MGPKLIWPCDTNMICEVRAHYVTIVPLRRIVSKPKHIITSYRNEKIINLKDVNMADILLMNYNTVVLCRILT